MKEQKEAVKEYVQEQMTAGRTIIEILTTIGIKRSTYYRWMKQAEKEKINRVGTYRLTPDEEEKIREIKEAHPEFRHRRIQGEIQKGGHYLSATSIYRYLKTKDQVEPYSRRPAPWKEPMYEIWEKNLLWGSDWTRMRIGGVRWYLLTVIDFYSRFLVAFDLIPSVNASHIKAIYQTGLKGQGISVGSENKPELRVDRGSPNTSLITKEFFEILGAELSFARVKRPTDNAITERFYGTIKQEEIYLVGNYPDETSAREEIGRYIRHYNQDRPHQALWNFTPAYVHQLNNKTQLLEELKEMKQTTRAKRKQYWINHQKSDSLNSLILSH